MRIWAAMCSVYIFWGATYLAIRFAVESFPPFLMASIRWSIAGLVLYGWMRLSGAERPNFVQWKTAAIVGLCLLVGGNGLVSWAEQEVASSIAAITIGSVPLWIVMIDAVRPKGVKPNTRTVLGILIGFLGIFILINPLESSNQLSSREWLSMLAILGAAFFWSIGSIFSRENIRKLPDKPLMASAMEMLAGAALLLLTGTILGEWKMVDLSRIQPHSLVGLVYLVIFGSLVGYVSYSWLLGVASTPLVSTYAYVNPLVAVLLGGLLGGEAVTLRVISAGILIIGAVFLTTTSQLAGMARRKSIEWTDLDPDRENPVDSA